MIFTLAIWEPHRGTAGRIVHFANPISGQVLTTIEVRQTGTDCPRSGADDDN